MDPEMVFLIPIVAIIGGFAVAITGILQKSKIRQLEYQERIAMIQRGMVPPPETHPSADRGEVFGAAVSGVVNDALGVAARGVGEVHPVGGYGVMYRPPDARASSFTTGGIVVIGIGLGLMMIISFAGGEPEAGLGVGGGIGALGLALLVCGIVENRRRPPLGFGPPPPLEPRSAHDSTGAGRDTPA